jgi:hypothetical protein
VSTGGISNKKWIEDVAKAREEVWEGDEEPEESQEQEEPREQVDKAELRERRIPRRWCSYRLATCGPA